MKKENKNCHPRMSLSGISLAGYVNKENTSYNSNTKAGDCRQKHSGMTAFFNTKAFTLIELLVVVLIIGILAAVALPQYQKAVIKSRIIQLQTFQRALATAQNSYFLANNTYPTEFSQLDISFDNWTAADREPLGGIMAANLNKDVVRYNDLFEITLWQTGNTGYFLDGPYKGCGFYVNFKTGKWDCREWYHYYKGDPGSFCQKIVGAGELAKDEANQRSYRM